MKLTMIYWKDGDWWVGRIRERPDVFSQGKDLDELEANLKEAYQLMCATDLVDVPPSSAQKDIELEAV